MTVPVIAHVLRLHRDGVLILSALCGVVLLYCVLSIAYQVTANRGFAFLVCLTTACTWPGLTAFHDLRGGYYDAAALCLLLLTMAGSSPIMTGICAFLACWTDERALIALPLVLLFFEYQQPKQTVSRGRSVAIALAGAAYLLSRECFADWFAYGTSFGGIGWSILSQQARQLPFGVWSGLGGSWLLIVWGLLLVWRKKDDFVAIAFAGALAVVVGAAVIVADVTRSVAYCLPAVFVALAILNREETKERMRVLVWVGAALSFLTPTLYFEGTNLFWLHPLPTELWALLRR